VSVLRTRVRQRLTTAVFVALALLIGCPDGRPDDDLVDDDATDDETSDDDDSSGGTDVCDEDHIIQDAADLLALQPCVTLNGRLEIIDQDWLTDIDLPNLETITSALVIEGNDALLDLDGLSSLTGSIWWDLEIRDNDSLTSMSGLSGLSGVVGALVVQENDALSGSLELPAVTTLWSVNVRENPNLVCIDLAGLDFVERNLEIEHNDSLATINLTSLTASGEGNTHVPASILEISYNPALVEIDLRSMSILLSSLRIWSNGTLADLDGLSGLHRVYDDVSITDNASLTSLDGLFNLERVVANLNISYNDCLDQAEAEDFASTIDVGGTTTVTDNDGPCPP
jgi:hypothetical protein